MKDKEFGKFYIHHRKILNEYLLIELENSGVIKIKYTKDGIEITLHTSQSLDTIQSITETHNDLQK